MSLAELLQVYTTESFCIDNINFNLECFNIKHNQVLDRVELQKLATHLAIKNSHKSAVGLFKGHKSDVGHAISMYDFNVKNKTFYYKDSSAKAYKFFQSENAQLEGLPLRIQDCNILQKAWTFKAEYNGAALHNNF